MATDTQQRRDQSNRYTSTLGEISISMIVAAIIGGILGIYALMQLYTMTLGSGRMALTFAEVVFIATPITVFALLGAYIARRTLGKALLKVGRPARARARELKESVLGE